MANKIPIDLKRVEELAGLGLTQAEIAVSLGISVDTLQRRARDSAAFAASIEKGKASAAREVANALFELCKKRNLGAIVWYEKTRRGLSDRLDLNVKDVDAAIERELEKLADGGKDATPQTARGANGGTATGRAADYRPLLAHVAPRPVGDRVSSGESQSGDDGPPLGQVHTGGDDSNA